MTSRRKLAGVLASSVVLLMVLVVAGRGAADDDADADPDDLLAAIEMLEPKALELWPDSFAGVWLGDSGVGDSVFIAFTEDADEKVARLASGFPRPDLLKPVAVDKSMAELETQRDQLVADRELARGGELELAGIPGHRYDLEIDPARNAVVVILEDARAAAVADIHARYGTDVLVEQGSLAAPAVCTREDCRYVLRSGLQTVSSVDACSTAFTVRRPNGNRNILSAAHCGNDNTLENACMGPDDGSGRSHGGEHYGNVQDNSCGGRKDAERHGRQDPFGSRAWIFMNPDFKEWEVRSVNRWENLVPGTILCKSGITSGKTCGQVHNKQFSPSYIPNSKDFIKAKYCVRSGDSGAGVYGGESGISHRAYGIVSGALGLSTPCAEWGAGNYSVTGHIEFAENTLDVTVVKAQ